MRAHFPEQRLVIEPTNACVHKKRAVSQYLIKGGWINLILFVYFQGSIKHKTVLTEYWEVAGETR